MERLTKRDIDGCLIHPWSFNGINGSYDIWDEDLLEKQIDRLAAYEDTGLEPEEIKDSIGRMSPICVQCDGKTSDGIRTEKCGYPDNITKCLEQSKHLSELAQAEQDGRLVVLPCKVGDTVYQIDAERVYESEVKWIIFDCDDIAFDERAIGGSIFLTREDAEAALALKGGEGL